MSGLLSTCVKDIFYRKPDAERQPLPTSRSTRLQVWLVGITCFLFFLILYGATVAPSVGLGHDTGELTTVCVLQGIPHSPGYPLFVAIGWLAQQLPIGDEPAYRLNLLCAVETAAAMGFLGAALTLAFRPGSALLATVLTGLSTAVWRQAVVTEVFALHLLFLCSLIWLAFLWELSEDGKRREILLWTSFILGCCLAHQHIIALAAPPLILYGVFSKGRGRAWGFSPLNLVVILTAVLSPYALQSYLAQQKPILNWMDPSSPGKLWAHFLRKSYGTSMLNPAAMDFDFRAGQNQVSNYFVSMLRNHFPFPSFCLLGLALDALLQRRHLRKGLLFLGIAAVYGPLFALWGNQPSHDFYSDLMERFYSSSILGVGGLLALGIDWLEDLYPKHSKRFWLLLLCLPLQTLVLNYPKCSQRGQYQSVDTMRATFRSLPPRSALFLSGDLPAGTADYLRYVKREFLETLVIYPGLTSAEWYRDRLPVGLSMAAAKMIGDPDPKAFNDAIVTYLRLRGWNLYAFTADGSLEGYLVAEGMSLHSYLDKQHALGEPEELARLKEVFNVLETSKKRGKFRLNWRQNFWIRYCLLKWIDAYTALGDSFTAKEPALAIIAYSRVIEMREGVDPTLYAQRADLYLRQKEYQKAISDFRVVLREVEDSRTALGGMVVAYQALGDQSKARRYEDQLKNLPGER